MHEICDPEIVDVFDFIGFTHIGPILEGKPTLFFDRTEQGVVMNRRFSE